MTHLSRRHFIHSSKRTILSNVEAILSKVEQTISSHNLLAVTYWLVHDDIASCLDDMDLAQDIKDEVVARIASAIVKDGTNLETISRARRHVLRRYRMGF